MNVKDGLVNGILRVLGNIFAEQNVSVGGNVTVNGDITANTINGVSASNLGMSESDVNTIITNSINSTSSGTIGGAIAGAKKILVVLP